MDLVEVFLQEARRETCQVPTIINNNRATAKRTRTRRRPAPKNYMIIIIMVAQVVVLQLLYKSTQALTYIFINIFVYFSSSLLLQQD
jgi:hypothetical protein